MTVKLDGSQSYDPDFSKTDITGIQLEWYCRRVDESFTSNYETTNKGAGCFKNGRYNLSDPATSQAFTEVSHHFLQISQCLNLNEHFNRFSA